MRTQRVPAETWKRNGSIAVLLAALTLIGLALFLAPESFAKMSSSTRKITVVTSYREPCTDCSAKEARKPNHMKLVLGKVGVLTLNSLDWNGWGSRRAAGRGRGRIETNGYGYGRVRIALTKPRRHFADGCGNPGRGRIYTKARLSFFGFPTTYVPVSGETITVSLPRTGCESY